jgi:hypothetical protein
MDDLETETSHRPADLDPPDVRKVGAIRYRPTFKYVAYFASLIFLVSLGFSLYHGRPAPDAVLIALVAPFVSLSPWWVYYRICGRNEGIAFWSIGILVSANRIGNQSTPGVLACMGIMSLLYHVVAVSTAMWKRPRRKPKAAPSRSLWDVEVDGPK